MSGAVVVPLTKAQVTLVDDCDAAWALQFRWYALKTPRAYYAARTATIGGRQTTVLMHRVIAERAGLEITGLDVDHIDGNGLNNTRSNLRAATRSNLRRQPPT